MQFTPTTRRRATATAGALVLSATLLLTSCASTGAAPADAGEPVGPFGAPSAQSIEVYAFDGGYGTEYTDAVIKVYNEQLPDSEVDLKSVQEISTQLQPRFVGGNPPDLIDNSGKPIETTTLADSGQLLDLGELLEAPSWDDPDVTVGETLTPGVVETGTYDGKLLELRYVNTAKGLWYSQSLFEEHGWEIPTTWDAFVELGEQAKNEGIALFAYPGQVISYPADVFITLIGKQAGIDALRSLDNLESGAWESDVVVDAFGALAELHDKDLILKGSEALTHTEAQTEFVRGEALFYPAGSWLENEMKGVTPEGFDMAITPIPLLDEATAALGFEQLQVAPGEPFIIPTEAKNPKGAMEYLRAMLSKEAASEFSSLTGAPTVVKGSLEGVDVTPALQTVTDAIEVGGNAELRVSFRGWYEPLRTQWFTTLGDVLAGRVSPEEASQTMQQAADEIAADDSITKYTRD